MNRHFILNVITSGKENKSGGLMAIFIPLEKLIRIHNESQRQG